MATQAPATQKSRSTPPKDKNAKSQGNGSGQATATQEPKVYVFGGSFDAPQPGANARRLWRFLTANLSKAEIGRIKTELRKSQPEDDRFVRWQQVVAACKTVGVETIKVGEKEHTVGQALVRNLQQEDKDGKLGRDASITIF